MLIGHFRISISVPSADKTGDGTKMFPAGIRRDEIFTNWLGFWRELDRTTWRCDQ
jgi:hypothetical protein